MARILVLVSNQQNQRLVADYIAGIGHRPLLARGTRELDLPFDLGIVDGPALQQFEAEILERKSRERPVALPFLLITSHKELGMAQCYLWRIIEEIILMPIEKIEFHARIENLLVARRLSAEFGSAVLTSAPAPVFVMEPNGRVRTCNIPATEFLRHDVSRTVPFPMAPPEALGLWRDFFSRLSSGECVQFLELPAERSDGRPAMLLVSATPLRDPQGKIAEILLLALDVTDRHRAEQLTRRRLRELELLRELSHTLRQCESHTEVLPKLLHYTLDAFAVADGAAWEIDNLRQRASKVASRGWGDSLPETVSVELDPLTSFLQIHEPQEVSLAELFPNAGTATHAFIVPVFQEHVAKGFLVVGLPTPDAFESRESYLRFAGSFADIAGIAIHRLELREETFRRLRQLETLHHIDVTIASSMERKVTSEILLRECAVQLQADGGSLWSFHDSSQQLVLLHSFGFATPPPPAMAKSAAPSQLADVLQTRDEVLLLGHEVLDAAGKPLLTPQGTPFLAYAGFPLIAKGRLIGALELFFENRTDFPSPWIEFARVLASQATIALENVQLFSDLKQLNKRLEHACEEILASWARTLDMRDHETENHSLRVAEYAVMVAEKLGIKGEQLSNLRRGALLHDVGKIAIPDAILLKPAPLSDEEWQIMRKHPVYARSMIEPITFLQSALAIPLYHHERYDGSGYPHGLAGEQIPIEARIFAVVDVWDALTSDRPYRPAWPPEKAIAYIREQAGKQFDPKVVEVFLSVLEETSQKESA